MKKIIKYFSLIGIVGLLFSCQKKDEKVEILANIITPTLKNVPAISFTKDMANDTVTFTGTKVNPGFTASATYYLEVDTAGDNFQHPTVLTSSATSDSEFKFTVSALNSVLLNNWLPYISNSVEFRIRAVLDQSNAGAGVTPIVSISPTVSATAVLYGLPQLNLVASGEVQGYIKSLTSDENYAGYVKLDPSLTYTFVDAVSGKIAMGGKSLSVTAAGYYKLNVDTATQTINQRTFNIGIIGAFDNWSGPDPKLDFNARKNYWYITYTLPAGDGFKFRGNDTWGDINMGANASSDTPFASGSLMSLNSGGPNIIIPQDGTYFITFTISDDLKSGTMTATLQ